MKTKLAIIIFSILLVLSVVGNVYLFNTNQSLNNSITESQSDIDKLNKSLAEKDTVISDVNNQLSETQSMVSELKIQIDELQTRIDNTTIVREYTAEDIEPTTMYVTDKAGAPIRKGASDDYISDETIKFCEAISVTGKTSNGWYRIAWGENSFYVASSLLSKTMPTTKVTPTPVIPTAPVAPSNPGNGDGLSCPNTGVPAPDVNWTTGL